MSANTLPAPERIAARSVSDVVEAVRSAHDDRAPLRIVGRGAWLHAGWPVSCTRTLDTSSLRGIVEYVPGDFTLTAAAGTTLAELAEATAAHGQWLPLDPFGPPDGTLGATLATASAGPLAGGIGSPRDLTLGVTFVTGTGEVVHGGGRVVKNVAGFDLVRLTIGAWGTLGVITEATVRLRARPDVDESFALALPTEADALGALLSALRVAAVDPLAAELVSPACAARIGLGARALLLVRLAGNATSVQHQRGTLARLATCESVAGGIWKSLQVSDPADAAVIRVSRRPSELARLWTAAMTLTGVDAHATLSRGIVRLRLTTPAPPDRFDARDARIVEVLPTAWRGTVEAIPEPNEPIARRLRDAFDPRRILNRGIAGEEAA